MPQRAWRWVPLAASIAGAGVVSAQQPFHAGVELVRLPVVVTGRDGRVVHQLQAGDFQVFEDGHLQQVAYFCEGAAGEALPLHLGLLLDGSESMDQDLGAAANAAVKFVKDLDEAADVTFVDFDTTVNVGKFQPDNYPRLFERIRARKAGGGTSLYDAIAVFVERTLGQDGQHVLLMYTDGGDSTSSLGYGKLQQLLRLGHVLVYAIGYMQNTLSTDRLTQQIKVSAIARETGGEAYFPQSPDEISKFYTTILAELDSRYTLGYVPADPKTDGKFHKVEVKLTRPDLKGAKVRTRSGYIAPTIATRGQ
ncbi:MAG: VWA domain-containing protein [Vicinamibacterales bacterium]